MLETKLLRIKRRNKVMKISRFEAKDIEGKRIKNFKQFRDHVQLEEGVKCSTKRNDLEFSTPNNDQLLYLEYSCPYGE